MLKVKPPPDKPKRGGKKRATDATTVVDIDPKDRKRWYKKFERTTEGVIRDRLSRGAYQTGDKAAQKRQAAFEWLQKKKRQRHRRYWLGIGIAVIAALIALLSRII